MNKTKIKTLQNPKKYYRSINYLSFCNNFLIIKVKLLIEELAKNTHAEEIIFEKFEKLGCHFTFLVVVFLI